MAAPASGTDRADDERNEREPLESGGSFRLFACAVRGFEGNDQETISKVVSIVPPGQGTRSGSMPPHPHNSPPRITTTLAITDAAP